MIQDNVPAWKSNTIRCPHCQTAITWEQIMLKDGRKAWRRFNDGGEKDGARHRCKGQNKKS